MNARAKLAATNRSTPRLDSAMVLAALPVPAVVLNDEDRFTFANGAAEQFFRLSAGALCQLKLSDILPPDNRVFAVLAQIRRFDSPVSDMICCWKARASIAGAFPSMARLCMK